MNRPQLAYFLLGITIPLLIHLGVTYADIPPTRAFSSIFVAGQNLFADSYNGNLTLNTQGSIGSSISSQTVNIRLVQVQCPAGQFFNGVGANGTLLCG